MAGEILQKYVNYGGHIAIYGDYSGHTSKPLRDFIYESNKGKDVFFVATEEEALAKLAYLQNRTPGIMDSGGSVIELWVRKSSTVRVKFLASSYSPCPHWPYIRSCAPGILAAISQEASWCRQTSARIRNRI